MNNLNSRVAKIERTVETSNYSETLEGQLKAFGDGKFGGIVCIMSLVVAFYSVGVRTLSRFPEPLRGFFLSILSKNKPLVRKVR